MDQDGNATVSVFVVDAVALNPRLLSTDLGGNVGDWRYAGIIPPSALQLVSEHDYTDDVEKECEECGLLQGRTHPPSCAAIPLPRVREVVQLADPQPHVPPAQTRCERHRVQAPVFGGDDAADGAGRRCQ